MHYRYLVVLLVGITIPYSTYAMQHDSYTSRPLLSTFTELYKTVAHIPLGSFPTPIKQLKNLGDYLNLSNVYMKMDNTVGGNKVRKLEFLLADAKHQGADTIITVGGYGSNHALTTAKYTQKIGLQSISVLKPQPIEDIVLHNFSLLQHYSSIYCCPENQVEATIQQLQKHYPKAYVIPTGGSNALGVIGFVNAAFELKQQIDDGVIKKPDYIFIPVGSCGTFTGLLLGLKATQLPITLIGITVEPEKYPQSFEQTIMHLFKQTNELLIKNDQSFPLIPLNHNDIQLLKEYCGHGYGEFTQEGIEAIELVKKYENIQLEGVYTAKAFAGMIDYCKKHNIKDEVIIFWNTFCSNAFEKEIKIINLKQLPE